MPQSALQLLASSGLVDASCYALGKGCGSCPANINAPGGLFRSRQLRTLAEVQVGQAAVANKPGAAGDSILSAMLQQLLAAAIDGSDGWLYSGH